MARQKLLLDTNIIIDFMLHREPHFEITRLLMLCGRVGEFSLWVTSSQVTDIIYIVTDGGMKSKIPETLEKLSAMRAFVNVQAVTDADIDKMLASSWSDPEGGLLIEIALKMRADAIITRNKDFPTTDLIRVQNCSEFFEWLKDEKGVSYDDVPI